MHWLKQLLLWLLDRLATNPSSSPQDPWQGRRKLTREDIERLVKTNGGPGGLDLTSCDFSSLDLRGIFLRGARLTDSTFYLTDLRESRLGNCDLRQANLHDARLDYTDLYIANLENGEVGKGHEKTGLQICRAEAAEKLNVSERSVNTAKKVQREAVPELVDAIQQKNPPKRVLKN